MVFFRLPQGKIFLATIDMVAPVSSTPRYSRPPSRIRCLALVLSFPTTFQLALAGVVAVALATAFARAFARILALQDRRQALLVVALILVVLPLPGEGTGDGAPVVIRHLRLGAGVGLLLFPLDYEAIALLAVGGVLQVTMLVSGITSEELLDIAHDTGVLSG